MWYDSKSTIQSIYYPDLYVESESAGNSTSLGDLWDESKSRVCHEPKLSYISTATAEYELDLESKYDSSQNEEQ
jgi:hypothetical protein